MWFRISDIIIARIKAAHLQHPEKAEGSMILELFQRESRSALHVYTAKKVFPQYRDTASGKRIPRREWTAGMREFAQDAIQDLPPRQTLRRITVFGWLFILLAAASISYAVYETLSLPAQKQAYREKLAEKSVVSPGEVFFGNYREYKEKGNMLGSKGGFGWFKVVRIEADTYYIAKSTDLSSNAKPKTQMDSTEFEAQAQPVKARELSAYNKRFVSEDGLTEFNFND